MKSEGFTLVELIVSISVLSVILVCVLSFFFAGISLFERTSNDIKSIEAAVFVADKITDDILQSRGISSQSDSAKLYLLQKDESIIYQYKNDKVHRQEGSSISYLTIENEIKGLKFDYPYGGVAVNITTTSGNYIFSAYPRNIQ